MEIESPTLNRITQIWSFCHEEISLWSDISGKTSNLTSKTTREIVAKSEFEVGAKITDDASFCPCHFSTRISTPSSPDRHPTATTLFILSKTQTCINGISIGSFCLIWPHVPVPLLVCCSCSSVSSLKSPRFSPSHGLYSYVYLGA